MVAYISLICCFIYIALCGGGLYIESLYGAIFSLSLASVYELIKACKADRLPKIKLSMVVVLIVLFIIGQTLPVDFFPNFMVSENHDYDVKAVSGLLDEGVKRGYFTEVGKVRYTYNYFGTLQFLLVTIVGTLAFYLSTTLSKTQKLTLMNSLLGAAMFFALSEIFFSWFYSGPGIFWWWTDFQPKLAFGAFINPNHYGVFLVLFIPFCIVQGLRMVKTKSWGKLVFYLSALIVLALGVVLSGSRGAYLLATGSLLLSLIFLFTSEKNRYVAVSGTLFAMLAVVFLLLMPQEMMREFSDESLSKDPRFEIYSKVDDIFLDHPWGLGQEGYRFKSGEYFLDGKIGAQTVSHSESTYFTSLLDGGAIFTLLLILLVIFYWQSVFDYARQGSRRIFVSCIVALLVVGVHFAFDHPVGIPLYTFGMLCLAGLLFPRGERYQKEFHMDFVYRLRYMSLLFPIILVALTFWVRKELESPYERKGDRQGYSELATIQELAEALPKVMNSWHHHYRLGQKIWDNYGMSAAPYVKKCYLRAISQQAKASFLWLELHRLTGYMQDKDLSIYAYRRYCLLLPKKEKLESKQEIKHILKLNDRAFENFLTEEIQKEELTQKFLRELLEEKR